MKNFIGLILGILFCLISVSAQRPVAVKANKREVITPEASAATSDVVANTQVSSAKVYSYEFRQPAFYINRIVIVTDAEGRGTITLSRKDVDEPITDPFTFSAGSWTRVRALWDELNFLDSSENYQSEKQFPHLGTMTLSLTQGKRNRAAEFNWTNNKTVETLVDEYRRAADQAQFVFDINLARENQPLNAPKLLERLEQLYQRKGLSDAQQLSPLLRDLSRDERIPLMARNRAAKVLQAIEKETH